MRKLTPNLLNTLEHIVMAKCLLDLVVLIKLDQTTLKIGVEVIKVMGIPLKMLDFQSIYIKLQTERLQRMLKFLKLRMLMFLSSLWVYRAISSLLIKIIMVPYRRFKQKYQNQMLILLLFLGLKSIEASLKTL